MNSTGFSSDITRVPAVGLSDRGSRSGRRSSWVWPVLLVLGLSGTAACSPGGEAPVEPLGAGPSVRSPEAGSGASKYVVLGAPSAGHLMLRAKDQLSSGNARAALQIFKQAEEAGFTGPELHFFLGMCYKELNDVPQMKVQLQKFLELAPAGSERAQQAATALQQAGGAATHP